MKEVQYIINYLMTASDSELIDLRNNKQPRAGPGLRLRPGPGVG